MYAVIVLDGDTWSAAESLIPFLSYAKKVAESLRNTNEYEEVRIVELWEVEE